MSRYLEPKLNTLEEISKTQQRLLPRSLFRLQDSGYLKIIILKFDS